MQQNLTQVLIENMLRPSFCEHLSWIECLNSWVELKAGGGLILLFKDTQMETILKFLLNFVEYSHEHVSCNVHSGSLVVKYISLNQIRLTNIQPPICLASLPSSHGEFDPCMYEVSDKMLKYHIISYYFWEIFKGHIVKICPVYEKMDVCVACIFYMVKKNILHW